MRRPPRYGHIFSAEFVNSFVLHRLGVGAPIPETSTSARESARLKTQLKSGKKRSRDGDGDIEKQSQSSDDDEESRAAVMQKRLKIDPFGGGKKQRKNQFNGLLTPQHTPVSSQAHISLDIGKANDDMEIYLDVSPTTTPRKKKKKRKKASNADNGVAKLSSPPPTPERDIEHQGYGASSLTSVALPPGSVRPEPPQPPVLLRTTQILPCFFYITQLHPASIASPKAMPSPARVRASQDAPMTLKLPLLNLDGPPPDVSDPEGDDNPSQSGSPKKRRKRRKKKKHPLLNPSPSTGS
jgi:hypothetical protein